MKCRGDDDDDDGGDCGGSDWLTEDRCRFAFPTRRVPTPLQVDDGLDPEGVARSSPRESKLHIQSVGRSTKVTMRNLYFLLRLLLQKIYNRLSQRVKPKTQNGTFLLF